MEIREMKSFLSSEFNRYITATDRLNSMLLTSAKRVKELEAKNEQLEQQLKETRKHLTESITRECKCEVNTSVNNDLVTRNLELKKLLERIVGMCGNPIASDGCRGILKLHKEYLTKYKVKE